MRRSHLGALRWPLLALYLAAIRSLQVTALDIKMCSNALGMESGAIPDSSITASSQYVPNVGPLSARLNTERQGGAWCPYGQLERGVREYIQVSLGGTMLVTAVATQGRHDRGRGQEYTKEYSVEYWRSGLTQWKPYIRWDGKQIFPGNTDTVTVIQNGLTPPVHAESIRIVPLSLHKRTVCLRLEIYGCVDDSSIQSYSTPVGSDEMGDHLDRKYDGVEEDGWLKDGLGRLTDGQVGQDFFLIDMGYAKGSGWIGWKNSSFPKGFMEMIFRLDQVRNVTEVNLYTNNYYTRHVQVFNAAVIFFSIGGKYYNGDPVVFMTKPDKVSEKARNVTVPISGGRVCRFIKARLYFSTEWIMLSEVYIQSEPMMDVNVTEEIDQRSFHDLVELKMLGSEWDRSRSGSQMQIVIVSLTCVIVILIIIFIVILVVSRHRNKYTDPGGTSALRNTFSMKINMKDLFVNWTPNSNNTNDTEEELHNYVPRPPMIIDEDLNHHVATTPKHERKHSFVSTSADALGSKTTVTLAAPVYNPSILPNILQNEFTLNELNHYEEGRFEEYPQPYSRFREPATVEYHEPSSAATIPTKRGSFVGSTLRERKLDHNTSFGGPSIGYKYKTQGRDYEPRRMSGRSIREARPFGLADLNEIHRKQFGTTGTRDKTKETPACTIWNVAPSMTLPFTGLEVDIISVPLHCLQLMSNFGNCPYGEISIYETQNINNIVPESTKLVQVRAAYFKKGENCIDYLKELRFLTSIQHPNICRVLGIIASEMPPLSIAEYTAAGDLCQLLRTARNLTDEPIRFPLLTFISIQICSAMKYLESRLIVHKDLATRNCLIFPGNRVKITDTAICSEVYKDDYHMLMGEKLLPVRWLSWESILLDRYTCPSTVWSYAVTLWEILSMCKTIPYSKLELEDLIHNAEQLFYGHELKEILPKPAQCPGDLYQLMAKCWRRDDAARPTFEELYKFLVMKFKRNVPNDYPL